MRRNILSAIVSLFIIGIVKLFWPHFIPFDPWEFWETKGDIETWIHVGWPILAWGIGATLVLNLIRLILTRRHYHWRFSRYSNGEPNGFQVLTIGTLVSLQAGIFEEMAFRWLIFLATIATVRIPNFFFFGFLGFGIPEWMHNTILGPIANWATLHHLESYLFNEQGWAVGAALLFTNTIFRDGHVYLGLFGFVNSWFLGMFFFWMMFHFGLPAAIVLHVLYDFLIFATIALITELKKE